MLKKVNKHKVVHSRWMNTAFLLLGSNSGDRMAYLEKAALLLEEGAGTVLKRSSVYSTEPWPPENSNQADFLNQALQVQTPLGAPELLKKILVIEEKLGRTRNKKWEARIIDIDILFYNSDLIRTTELSVPHPFLQERRFALAPLAEIAPDFIHPVLKKTVRQLLHETADGLSAVIHRQM